MRGAQGQRRHLTPVRRRTVAPALLPGPAGTRPNPHPCSQLAHQRALRPRRGGRWHLHHRRHHQAMRGARGQRRHLTPVRRRTVAPAFLPDSAGTRPHAPSPLLAAWVTTSSAASPTAALAPTPPRASTSCARGSGGVPSPRSGAPPHRSARSLARPRWHPPPPSPFCSQLGRQRALRYRHKGRGHLHHRGHHQAVRGAPGQRRHLTPVRRRTVGPALLSGPAGTRPHPHPCSQLVRQPALRPRHLW